MIKTIIDLVDTFESTEGIALVHNGEKYNYYDLYRKISSLSFSIKDFTKDNNKVIIRSSNKFNTLLYTYSVIYSGGVAIPVSDKFNSDEVREIIEITGADFILTDNEKESFGLMNLVKSFKNESDDKIKFEPKNENADEIALILLTSGTTGRKKATLLSHSNLIKTSKYINDFMQLKEKAVEYLMVPVFHSFGFARSRCVFMKKGTLVLDDGGFNPLIMIRRMRKYPCSSLSGVPATFALLINIGDMLNQELADQVDCIELGSSPMNREHKTYLMEKFKNARVCMHYGLTEASRSAFIEFRSDIEKIDSVGKSSPGVEIKILDGHDNEIDDLKVGEIVIKGPNVTKGYLNASSLNESKFKKGWFYTGDLGYKDSDGYIYYVSRKDSTINIGGEKLIPVYMEKAIKELDLLEGEFCVVGRKDDVYGEVPILCTEDKNIDKEILQDINSKLSSKFENNLLLKGFYQLKTIPKTHNGKIKRIEVSKIVNNES